MEEELKDTKEKMQKAKQRLDLFMDFLIEDADDVTPAPAQKVRCLLCGKLIEIGLTDRVLYARIPADDPICLQEEHEEKQKKKSLAT